ncbi:lysin B [Gordonia phage NadineRae]|uniref:Lysin B n=1 Tax=Gordonia phage NadineRae TaxID=2652882 RepID=A0A5P8DFE0_9CAUD|nr:lysin B [Gordonia phage NadineRae]QFP97703.1 lysin B [Gordonia phage NadineRae]
MSEIAIRSLRGTGEPLQWHIGDYGAQPRPGWGINEPNMMDDIVKAGRELEVGHYPVPYHASIAPAGGTKMFHESYHDGWQKVTKTDATSGTANIWIGYSLGALILGDVAAAGELNNCIGMILLSDPAMPKGGAHPACKVPSDRYGCTGSRAISGPFPKYWISASDDPISALSQGNGFRAIASVVTGEPQPFNPGYLNVPAIIDAVRRYLGTPPVDVAGRRVQEAVPSRHVIYASERMPGSTQTYTAFAGTLVKEMINRHKENQ